MHHQIFLENGSGFFALGGGLLPVWTVDRRFASSLCVNPGVRLGFELHTHQIDVLAASLDLDPGLAAHLPHRLDELVRRHGPLVRRLAVDRIGHIGVCDLELALTGFDLIQP